MRKLANKLVKWALKDSKPATQERGFAGARVNRLVADWMASGGSADWEIKGDHKTLRERARELDRDNDYIRRFHALLLNNVLGSTGIGMQSKVRERVQGPGGRFIERYDDLANTAIEKAWGVWGQARHATIHGNLTWTELQRLVLRSVARDGAVLVRVQRPTSHPHRFTLEPMEIDHLDTDFTSPIDQQTVVRLGVQYARDGSVQGYWLKPEHPGTIFQSRVDARPRVFVPATEMFHIFKPDRVGQSTGVPWCASSMAQLNMLAKYQEAEVVAARSAAAKMGFLVTQPGSPAGEYTGEKSADGSKYMEAEPGSIEVLPTGLGFQSWDPTHPTSAYPEFVKAMLRGISSGLAVSYVSLANDLEGVNYSSIRAGLLEEREEWKSIQGWFIGCFVRPVFEQWLLSALLVRAVQEGPAILPAARFDKFNSPEFKPRRWPWVDPLKDMQASVMSVEKGFTSRRAVIAENGGDIENTFQDIASDEALEKEYGLDFEKQAPPPPPATVDKPEEEEDEQED